MKVAAISGTLLAAFMLAGCVTSTEPVRFQAGAQQQAVMRDGFSTLFSKRQHSIVRIASARRLFDRICAKSEAAAAWGDEFGDGAHEMIDTPVMDQVIGIALAVLVLTVNFGVLIWAFRKWPPHWPMVLWDTMRAVRITRRQWQFFSVILVLFIVAWYTRYSYIPSGGPGLVNRLDHWTQSVQICDYSQCR
jgi:hypothetical protein